MSTWDVGGLDEPWETPRERDTSGFVGGPRLDPPVEDPRTVSPVDFDEVVAAVEAREAERRESLRWCPAMPPAFSLAWQRIEAARMGMVVLGHLRFGAKQQSNGEG